MLFIQWDIYFYIQVNMLQCSYVWDLKLFTLYVRVIWSFFLFFFNQLGQRLLPLKKNYIVAHLQVCVDDIPFNTKQNDIILENDLFENRSNFLSFCQQNHFQFDTLRHAKYSSMMILYHLKKTIMPTVWKGCDNCCPEYKERNAVCHQHKLNQDKLNQKSEMPNVLKHAFQCRATKAEPFSHPYCSQIKKMFSHASKCKIRVNRGGQHCKKILTSHSRNCKDSKCELYTTVQVSFCSFAKLCINIVSHFTAESLINESSWIYRVHSKQQKSTIQLSNS